MGVHAHPGRLKEPFVATTGRFGGVDTDGRAAVVVVSVRSGRFGGPHTVEVR